MDIGRISGKLLVSNLLRDGVDLAFETDLLYLDVNSKRIGINQTPNSYDLDVNSSVQTNDLLTGNSITIDELTINVNNSITSLVNPIEVFTADPFIFHDRMLTDSLIFDDNKITTFTNENIILDPNGSGIVDILSGVSQTGNLSVLGNIDVTGNIRIDGTITLGDNVVDTVEISADLTRDIIPSENNSFNIGTPTLRWRNIRLTAADLDQTISIPNFVLSSNPTTIASTIGDIVFVFPAGDSETNVDSLIIADSIKFEGNLIEGLGTNENLRFNPNASGTINLEATANILNNLSVSTNIDLNDLTVNGNITLGDASTDTTTINAGIINDLIPDTDLTYNIGSLSKRWRQGYVANVEIENSSTAANFIIDNTPANISVSTGNINFVFPEGNSTVTAGSIIVSDAFRFEGNLIEGLGTNENLRFNPNASGTINLEAETNVTGDFSISGNSVLSGDLSTANNLIIGDQITDTVAIAPDLTQDIIPGTDRVYDLGRDAGDSSPRYWQDAYILDNTNITSVYPMSITVSEQTLIDGTTNTISTIQSNDTLSLLPATGVTFVEELKLESVPGGFIIPPLTIDNPNAFNTSASDSFGNFVDISDSYVLVGAIFEDDAGGTSSGKAYIFDKSTGTLLHTLDNPNAYGTTAADNFGTTGAITDTYAVISAQNEDQPFGSAGSSSGKVYVFSPATGSLIYTLDNPNPVGTTSVDRFGGGGIALSNRYLTIGTPSEDPGGSAAGAAYIYDLDNYATTTVSGSFEFGNNSTLNTRREINVTTVPGMSSDDLVTQVTIDSVDIRGALGSPGALDIKFAGAASYDNYTSNVSDATYRNFAWLGGDIYLGQFTSKSFSIDVDPNAFVSFSPSGMPSGYYWQVRVNFTITKLVGVKYLADPNVTGLSSSDVFGTAVGVSDTYTIVGAPSEDVGGSDSGTVYIYDNASGNLLHTINNPNAYGTAASDRFGTFVDISDTYAIVGAFNEDDAGGPDSGKVYIFSSITGTLLHTLDNPNPIGASGGDQFGVSVQINNDFAVIGAQNEDEATANGSGKVYIFDPASGTLLQTLDNPNAFGTPAGDLFGNKLALHNTDLVVGAVAEDDAGGGASGKVYVYQSDTEGGVITNLNTSTPLTLAATGAGYYKFDGTNAMLLPAGDDAARPSSPEVGDTRWSTERDYLEVYDGTVYLSAAGDTGTLTAEDIEDNSFIYTIILG